MAGTTVSGIGSNVDTQAIVKSLVAAEKAPKQTQINNQSLKATTTLSSIGKVQSALSSFRSALATMNTTTIFGGLTATSSDEKTAKVTLSGSASNGSFALKVEQLATASKISTKVYEKGASSVVNAGTTPSNLVIKQGDTKFDVSVPAGATLQQVRDSINSQYGAKGISANILTDATGSRMVLTTTTMGEGSDLSLQGDSGLEDAFKVIDPPQNALYSIDGIEMVSKTNDIADAISGVSLQLIAPTASGAAATTVSVSTSSTQLKSAVKGFVDTYNALLTAINAETKVTKSEDGTQTAGALTGDATMRTLTSTLRNELNAMSGTGELKSLAQFGVSTNQTSGLLEINDKKWDAAVATNASDLKSIFTGDNGLLMRLQNSTADYARSNTGILAARSASLTNNLNDLTKQQTALETRMDSLQLSLMAKYNAMDTLVAQITASATSMMTTLNSLNNPKST